MANIPQLVPDKQFPDEALRRSVQEQPPVQGSFLNMGGWLTMEIASVSDEVVQWGRWPVLRDRQLRDFWPTEPYLAGAMANVCFRNSSFLWEVSGPERVAQIESDMLNHFIAGDTIGWVSGIERLSQDLYSQDNGAFLELIRDPGEDVNSLFQNERAPVIGIANLDAGLCMRTGNAEYPVIYTDLNGIPHKLAWYQVIPFCDFPSSIEAMHGIGYCAVTRALRLAQAIRSIMIYKNEKVSGRHYKQMHFVSGVSRSELKDEMKRGQEDADNQGQIRFVMPAILASLDPERPVSTATIDLASLPDGFDFDNEMKWYISGLALDFGVDYQEFAPLASGNIGSSQQSIILDRKSSGKGPANFMLKLSHAFKTYGVLPRGCEMIFQDKNEQEELERQTIRTKAIEEYAMAARSGILTPDAIRQDSVRRKIYDQKIIGGIEKDYGIDILSRNKQPTGGAGGNTLAQDAGRQDTGAINPNVGGSLRKNIAELIKKLPGTKGIYR